MNKITTLLFLCFFTVSCLEAPSGNREPTSTQGSDGLTGGSGNGNGAVGGDDSLNGDDVVIPKIEIRHLIEPKVDNVSDSGSYKRKLTIPKNFNNFLYVAGINVQTLADKNLRVRFNFGLNSAPITIQATLATATPNGLTSSSPVEVLALDLRSRPFNDVQLIYDLYDYNDYDFDGSGNNPAALSEPVGFNRNDGLFCRALALKDDPTFGGNSENKCQGTNDICKFTFAKVLDKGLVKEALDDNGNTVLVPVVPSEQSSQSGNVGLYSDADEIKLQRCLPDNPFDGLEAYQYDNTTSFLLFGDHATISGDKYYYQGPYRTSSFEQWQIESQAIVGKYGLFGEVSDENLNNLVDDDEIELGYKSKLFPLYIKYDLKDSVEYLGSIVPDGEKTLFETNTATTSEWMDGCNARATTVHNITGEHIGSCTVTATIELIAEDDDGTSTTVDITNEIKLQLVRPSDLNTSGVDVLADSFNQCSSSNQCGSDSCCINKRCWSRDIVKQCIEDLPSFGNQVTGDSCSSDFQCSSLCCNKVAGKCAPHDTASDNPTFCSKPAQQSCVAKEWCAKSPVTTCAIVNTGNDQFGGITCAKRCITVETFGECTSSNGVDQGVCIPPTQPATIVFDQTDPDRCEGAINYNELEECANNPEQCTL